MEPETAQDQDNEALEELVLDPEKLPSKEQIVALMNKTGRAS